MLAKVLTTRGRSADFSSEPVQVEASGNPGFDERLTREILQSERTRMLIVAGLSGSLVVIFPVLVLVFRQNYARIFGTAWAVQVIAVFVLLATYELVIRQVVGRRREKGKFFRDPLLGQMATGWALHLSIQARRGLSSRRSEGELGDGDGSSW
jgi:hypothetical protein